ncbi:MAG TPA: DUF1853 family protein [Chitinophagales bacterium]|nr:DUF1853 family protein [Chitinophagales bacterium]
MNNKSRISSIINAAYLDASITDFPSFKLSKLDIVSDFNFELPTHLRLGHLVENIVSKLIKSSTNYKVLFENIQFIENEKTIGEIDFIVSNEKTNIITHIELAYKFYLYDPTISSIEINNWIGPNRNDSLKEKLDKLKNKQFPLLYSNPAKLKLNEIEIKELTQELCFLVSLFIPYEYKTSISLVYQKAIKGYYLNIEKLMDIDHSEKYYYIPLKKEWGISPSENETWRDFNDIKNQVINCIQEKQSLLCWQKYKDTYSAFFIVWW